MRRLYLLIVWTMAAISLACADEGTHAYCQLESIYWACAVGCYVLREESADA